MAPETRKRKRITILSDDTMNQHHAASDDNSESVIAQLYKNDLDSIRATVTCSVCDQLLYEPWTLGCGHTYCYSCLCSWFVSNKHKKTCPDCRTAVRYMPASSFLIKNIVQVFVNRRELLPLDETIEEHNNRRLQENDLVERDKESPLGLFKGCFSSPIKSLRYDESDLVYRCTGCGTEWEGGSACNNCGIGFNGDEDEAIDHRVDFSDDGMSELSSDEEFRDNHLMLSAMSRYGRPNRLMDTSMLYDHEDSGDSSEEEDTGSLDQFVVHDNSMNRTGYDDTRSADSATASQPDDEEVVLDSDEESITPDRLAWNQRSGPFYLNQSNSSPSAQSPISHISINSNEDSDGSSVVPYLARDYNNWSPLEEHTNDDMPEHRRSRTHVGHRSASASDQSDEDGIASPVNRRSRFLQRLLHRRSQSVEDPDASSYDESNPEERSAYRHQRTTITDMDADTTSEPTQEASTSGESSDGEGQYLGGGGNFRGEGINDEAIDHKITSGAEEDDSDDSVVAPPRRRRARSLQSSQASRTNLIHTYSNKYHTYPHSLLREGATTLPPLSDIDASLPYLSSIVSDERVTSPFSRTRRDVEHYRKAAERRQRS